MITTDMKHSINSHERRVFSGATVARITRSVSKAREKKIEGGLKSLDNGRQNSADEKKGQVEFICPHCNKVCSKSVGLSVHLTRWCKMKPGGAGSLLPLAAHDTSNSSAQNHKSVTWSYALTHVDSKRPRDVLNTIQVRLQLKLPNSNNRKNWKNLDNYIFTKIVSSISDSELRLGKSSEVLHAFTDIVYNSAADFCGTHPSQERKEYKIKHGPHRKPALLHKITIAKRNARREFRRAKRSGGDVITAHKAFMRAVRAHHDILCAISKNERDRKKTVECNQFLRDPHKFAKRLLSPPVIGKPNFPKQLAETYFTEAYKDPNRSYCYKPPFDMPRPAPNIHLMSTSQPLMNSRTFAVKEVMVQRQV